MNITTLDKINSNKVFVPLSYFAKDFDNTFSMCFHRHAYIEVMYCRSGSFVFECIEEGTAKITRHLINSNDFILIESGVFHQIYVEEGTAHIYNIELSPEPGNYHNEFEINSIIRFDFSGLIKNGGDLRRMLSARKSYYTANDNNHVGNTLLELIGELSQNKKNLESSLLCRIMIYKLFIQIGKCFSSDEMNNLGISYVKKALIFIRNNYTKNITTDDIALAAQVNKSYLQRLFKEYTGRNILKTVNYYRIEACKNLISTTTLSSTQIAAQTGFQNRQHYSYEFKKLTNKTPSEYKKEVDNFKIDYSSE